MWENKKHQEYNYSVGDKVLIVKDGKLQKMETLKEGPHEIIQIFANGTVTIQHGIVQEHMNIWRLVPFHKL